MKELKLDKGLVTFVDDEDFIMLSRYRWIAKPSRTSRTPYYAVCNNFHGKRVFMHGILMPDVPDGCTVDHADRNGLNNQKSNLRHATRQQQTWNQAKRNGTQLPYKGVRLQKDRQHKLARPWQARVKVNDKTISLGYYATPEEAARAFDAYQLEHRVGYEVLNFPS